MTRQLGLAFLVFSALLLSGCGESSTTAQDESPPPEAASAAIDEDAQADAAVADAAPCKIVMGWDPWEPYQYMDVDGDLRGLDIELVRAIAAGAGCELEFEEGRWATLLGRLQGGSVDMLTGATRTAARESFARFSRPYRDENFKLYVRLEDVEKYQGASLEELLAGGFRVGVTDQYVYGDNITSLQENPQFADQFVGATIGELNYVRLLDLGIEGFIEDPVVAAWTLRSRGMSDQIGAHPLQIHTGDVTLMFSRASVSPETVARIDAAIAELKASGAHGKLLAKYLRTSPTL